VTRSVISAEASVTHDINQISSSAGTRVMRDCQIDRNATVSHQCHKLDSVRGTPLDLSSFRFPSLSIYYYLIPSTSTGSLSGDCDCYGHSHVI
jgi:hypothetical protein